MGLLQTHGPQVGLTSNMFHYILVIIGVFKMTILPSTPPYGHMPPFQVDEFYIIYTTLIIVVGP